MDMATFYPSTVFLGVIFGLFSPEPEIFWVERNQCSQRRFNQFTRRGLAFMCSFVLSNICLWCVCVRLPHSPTQLPLKITKRKYSMPTVTRLWSLQSKRPA